MHPIDSLTKWQRDLPGWRCEEQAVSRDTARLMKDKHRLPALTLVRKGYVRVDLCRVYCRNRLWMTPAGFRAHGGSPTESVDNAAGPPAPSPVSSGWACWQRRGA